MDDVWPLILGLVLIIGGVAAGRTYFVIWGNDDDR